ncbi:glycosyltransferase family 4 protein [Chloroflexota bacterium]
MINQIRILQVVQGFPPRQFGGTEIYTYNLSNELARRHEVHLFYPKWSAKSKNRVSSFIEREQLVIHELNLSNWSFLEKIVRAVDFERSYKNKKVEKVFEDLLNEIKPHIVHFQHLINLSTSLIEVAKSKNISTVLTLHDCWFICPRTRLLKSDYSICNGPDENGTKCFECWSEGKSEALANYLAKYFFPRGASIRVLNLILRLLNPSKKFRKRKEYIKSLLLRVDRIVVPSKFVGRLFVNYGITGDKILLSENGYLLSRFDGFHNKKREEDRIVFGFLGGVDKHKGVDVLIEAFNKIRNKNVELRIYGDYDPKSVYFRHFKAKIKNVNVRFLGRFLDVREPFSEIDVLIVPSICYEAGGPTVVLEAFIARKPAIASESGSIPEFVKNGVNGLLFEMGNPDDLCDKIKAVIENPGLIEKFKVNIKAVRTIEEQANELERLYLYIRAG